MRNEFNETKRLARNERKHKYSDFEFISNYTKYFIDLVQELHVEKFNVGKSFVNFSNFFKIEKVLRKLNVIFHSISSISVDTNCIIDVQNELKTTEQKLQLLRNLLRVVSVFPQESLHLNSKLLKNV